MLLTPEQLEALGRIVARNHASAVLRILGPQALTREEAALFGEATEEGRSMRDAFVLGRQLIREGTEVLSASYGDLRAASDRVRLSRPEQLAVESAEQHAGAHIRHLGAKITQVLATIVFREDAEMRAKLLAEEVVPATRENLLRRRGIQKLKSELGHRVGDWTRDWNRVAVTEKANAMNSGIASAIAQAHGDAWVYKQTLPGACPHCVRLHTGPDGHPRIFRLSTLQANGTNAGKKAADWDAVVGTTHPHCQCQLVRVPDGWGFDATGALVPGGRFGVRYEDEASAEKAMRLEDELQKAFRVKSKVSVQGIPVAVEQEVGDVRPWVDASGYEGATRMVFAYGYVEGTLGPDGDEYDCYVGPDPLAPFVYVVHQNDPETGRYDEDKAMIGFPSLDAARLAYLAHYDSPEFLGTVSQMPVEEFREKVGLTRRRGSMQSDGMVKGPNRPGLRPEDAAQRSVMGQRAVSPTSTGVNYVLGSPLPIRHLQAVAPDAVLRPEDVTRSAERKKQAGRKNVFVAGHGLEKRKRMTVDEVGEWGDRPYLVYPYEEGETGPRASVGMPAVAQADENRFFLDAEIARRLSDVSPNYARPETRRPRLAKAIPKTPLAADLTRPAPDGRVQKAGPFYGPRGGKWADERHTIPWKERIMRRPLRTREPAPAREWREGYPPGIEAPDFASWTVGQRGGTEQKHWDEKAGDFTPARRKVHDRIRREMLHKAKPAPEGEQPHAVIAIGGPGSGKSTVVSHYVDSEEFVQLDADAIKSRIPEYGEMVEGHWRLAASAVHHESTTIMAALKAEAIESRRPLLIDTTGADLELMLKDIQGLRDKGYRVRVVMPHLEVDEGLKRVRDRAARTGRFVPDAVVKAIYGTIPHNVTPIAALADEFDLIDNGGEQPRLAYAKRNDAHVVEDEAVVKKIPGLFKMVTASAEKKPGPKGSPIRKAGGLAAEDRADVEALLTTMGRRDPRPAKYDVDAGDYGLDLLVDGLDGRVLKGSEP